MDNLADTAAAALRDAGAANQASARALLTMWARLSLLTRAERDEVIRRFPFEPSCDFDPPEFARKAVPMGPNSFGATAD